MTGNPNSVIVKQLNIRGHAEDVALARQQLPHLLDQCSWPDTAEDEIIIIRRLHIRQPLNRLASATAERTYQLYRQAVDFDSPNATQAAAVRFRNRAQLNAQLILDILNPGEGIPWYWQQWQALFKEPKASAISELLRQTPLAIPATFHQLATRDQVELWSLMSEHQALAILQSIAATTGWRDILPTPGSPIEMTDQSPEPLSPIGSQIDNATISAIGNNAGAAIKLQLAAVILLWRNEPRLLQMAATPRYIAHLVGRGLPELVRAKTPPEAAIDPSTIERLSSKAESGSSASAGHAKNQQKDTDESSRTNDVPPSQPLTPTPALTLVDHSDTTRQHDAKAAATLYRNDGIISRWGGLFYLLNLLNLPAMKNLWMAEAEPVSGWHWLYHLAQSLDCEPDPALLMFLTEQAGLDTTDALTDSAQPASLPQVATWAEKRYGTALWRAQTFAREARLIGDHSHIDVHFGMDAVDLEIRRQGLDINPGWLPWLGRVVQFHYGSGREPGIR